MKLRPADQTLALFIAAIVTVAALRISWAILYSVPASQDKHAITDDPSPAAVGWVLWHALALILGLFYCIRASLAARHSRPLVPRTGNVLVVAWLFVPLPVFALLLALFPGAGELVNWTFFWLW